MPLRAALNLYSYASLLPYRYRLLHPCFAFALNRIELTLAQS